MWPPQARPHHANALGVMIWRIASEEVPLAGSATRVVRPLLCVIEENVMPVAGSKYFEASCAQTKICQEK